MKLPRVIAPDNAAKDRVILELEIVPDLEAFAGHFPGNPILPGVVQIDWVVRFAALYLDAKDLAARDFQVKYRNIIRPDAPLSLTLQLDTAKNQLGFAYQSGETLMASGTLKLQARA